MAIKRVVSTEFWTDGKVVDMFSPEDKYFMLYLLTNPHTTQLGIYKLNPKIAAFELGYSQEAVVVLLDRFENKYELLKYCKETQEVALKNYLKHSIVKGGKPVLDLLNKELAQVKATWLIRYVFGELNTCPTLNATVSELIFSYFNNNENDNDNDNDNEESSANRGRIVDESSKPTKKKPQRHKYGRYLNVLLTDNDMEKLMNEFPMDWQDRIERLSEYVECTGKKYKSHLATIRSWARRDKTQAVQQSGDIWGDAYNNLDLGGV